MSGKFLSLAALVSTGIALLSVASCGRSQQLTGITIQPAVQTFGSSSTPVIDNAGAQVQLRALGSYIHPPVTKDITNQVTWASNTVQMFTVDATGVLTATGQACGSALISATVNTNSSAGGISSSGAIVIGFMTASVVCPSSSGGGTGNPLLSVTFLGKGSGTVVSSPLNLSCSSPGPCSTQAFAAGTLITLTATANSGFTFGGWANCPVQTTTSACAFTLGANTVVTASFN